MRSDHSKFLKVLFKFYFKKTQKVIFPQKRRPLVSSEFKCQEFKLDFIKAYTSVINAISLLMTFAYKIYYVGLECN